MEICVKKLCLILLALSLFFGAATVSAFLPSFAEVAYESEDGDEQEMKGVWVTTVLNLDYPKKPSADAEVLKAEALTVIENCAAMGFNNIFLQVRPSGDAIYKSDLAPWSQYLTGECGKAPSGGFDPLKFWIAECHRRGIKLHAWLNPYRLSMGDDVEIKYPPEWFFKHTDGRYYLNPGVPAVREHLVDIVRELTDNYEVDGIHFDDYFYPSKDVGDQKTFEKYNPDSLDRRSWRISNVDALVRAVHDVTINAGRRVSFGVSPFGIWANQSSHYLGSATSGFESLISQYADTRKWVSEGWVDYICPQIYWNIGYRIADFEVLANWWADVVRGTGVKLYIGLASYKACDPDADSVWHGTAELLRQLNYADYLPEVGGAVHFRYGFFAENPKLREFAKNYNNSSAAGNTDRTLAVGRPSQDISVSSEKIFIGGVSDPNHPLFLNGKEVKERTASGFFGLYVDLADGVNTFKFENAGNTFTRIVTKVYPKAYTPTKIGGITRALPEAGKAYYPGEKFEIGCIAPAGTTVIANLGGAQYTLAPEEQVEDGYAVWYSKVISVVPGGAPRVVWLGAVKYDCYRGGTLISSMTSSAPTEIIMQGAPLHAKVTAQYADTFEDNSRNIGAYHIIPRGTKEYLSGEDGDLYRLSSGLWVRVSDVELVWEALPYNRVRTAYITKNSNSEVITINSAYTPTAYIDKEGQKLIVSLHGLDIRNGDILDAGSGTEMLSSIKASSGRLELALRDDARLGGYYIDSSSDGEIKIVLRKKKVSEDSKMPLKGVTIMLDPGHGGSDSGGISLFGANYSEKSIVLRLSFRLKNKLEALGAQVLMTRADDTDVSLRDRLIYSRKYLPDLFVSMHTDSVDDTFDLTKVRGASVYYRHDIARQLSDEMSRTIYENSELNDRGSHVYNFYVCRGTWVPSILVENGFAPSPFDLEFVMDDARSEVLLNDYVRNIVEYFMVSQ